MAMCKTVTEFRDAVNTEILKLTSGEYDLTCGNLPTRTYLHDNFASGFHPRLIAEDIVEYWIGVGIVPLEN